MEINFNSGANVLSLSGVFDNQSEDNARFTKILAGLDAREPLTIELDSPGGSVTQGFDFYRQIKALKQSVAVITRSQVASIGTVVAAAADKFIMGQNAVYQLHQPAVIQTAKINKQLLEQIGKIISVNENAMLEVYAEKSLLPKNEIQQLIDEEKILSADEALRLGFADEIEPVAGKMVAESLPVPISFLNSKILDNMENKKPEQPAPTPTTDDGDMVAVAQIQQIEAVALKFEGNAAIQADALSVIAHGGTVEAFKDSIIDRLNAKIAVLETKISELEKQTQTVAQTPILQDATAQTADWKEKISSIADPFERFKARQAHHSTNQPKIA